MKRVAVLLMVFVLVACSVSSEADQNVAIVKAMFEAFNRHDWQKMTSYYSEDAKFLDPSYGRDYVTKTRSEIASKYAEMEKMFPDIQDHLVGTYASGDKVTVEFISTGTISDSVQFKLPIVTVLTLKDGFIVQDATYYDMENP